MHQRSPDGPDERLFLLRLLAFNTTSALPPAMRMRRNSAELLMQVLSGCLPVLSGCRTEAILKAAAEVGLSAESASIGNGADRKVEEVAIGQAIGC